MGFFSVFRKFLKSKDDDSTNQHVGQNDDILSKLRDCEPRLSAWLDVVLNNVDKADDLLWQRLTLFLKAVDISDNEVEQFINSFKKWLESMNYSYLDEFRSELQYRLALALEMEDEEDEQARVFKKLGESLSKTRNSLGGALKNLFLSNRSVDNEFWDNLEEIFIMADMGYEATEELIKRLKKYASDNIIDNSENILPFLQKEISNIFKIGKRIVAVNTPEVVLMIGVNGAGKTTTIAKLAYRARMQGKKVLIAAADTFRAAAIEQLQIWANRVDALFYAKSQGSDPASVAYEAIDEALKNNIDVIFIDTAGRLQSKTNLMEELNKIRQILGKKVSGAPHRSILVLDATTGQNALSQAKHFKDSGGADEIILTKLDGTAKGGVAVAIAMQYHLPITYLGLGEKMEDLRPFDADSYAKALLDQSLSN